MRFFRLAAVAVGVLALAACGGESEVPSSAAPAVQPAVAEEPARTESSEPQSGPLDSAAGGVSVAILPDNPKATDCLRAVIRGVPGRGAVTWSVNGKVVATGTDAEFCNGGYQRNDRVSVEVGTSDKGARTTVSIANSPPRVVDISSTPAEIFAGADITVVPVAEDADGDRVDFKYQWLINGEADPLLTEATLPGDRFRKGDKVQVLIVPNDFYDDGPTYESYAQPIPNAPPRITSQPPQGISSLDYRYQVEVSDPDDRQFTYRLAEAPAGMSIDEAGGLIQWSLAEVAPGDYTIAIIVKDPDGAEAAQEYRLTLGTPQ